MSKSKKRRRVKRSHQNAPQSNSAVAIPPTTESEIATALQFQQSGNLGQAKTIYCQILEREPENPNAWHLLGMTLFAAGQPAEAIDCLQNANTIVPNHPDVLANLGVVYRGAGELDLARGVLEQAVMINPNSLAAATNLGTVLMELSEFDAASEQFLRVLELDPTYDNAAMNLGNVWQQQRRLNDAESLYREILERKPNDSVVLNNLGETLRSQGRWADAAEVLKQSLLLVPNAVETQINLGRTIMNLGQNEEAQTLFANLVSQNPGLAKPYHYLGKTFFDAGDMAKAVANIEQSIMLDPADSYALSSLGFTYLEMGRSEEAATCFRTALEKSPGMSEAHGCLLFVMSGDAEMCQQTLFEEHVRWGKLHGNVEPAGLHTNDRQTNRRLRIGYVSPDFRQHAVASFFRPVLEMHDPELVETFCYSETAVADEMTARIKNLTNHWRPTKGLSDTQVAHQIFDDKIDILVDLAGHTSGNRLRAFASRPAPVQVTWLGYPNTTGLEAIDYRLTCETQNPSGEPSYHTEQLVRMPRGSFCFSTPNLTPEIRPSPAIKNGYITFGSLHRPFKISEPVRDLWADVLKATPNSKLLVFNTRFTDETTTKLFDDLAQRGIARDRVEIRNEITGETYLNVYNEIDIALDVFPWSGGTTTAEALWMGVSVIALYGDRRSARSTAAILKISGLEQLIAQSPQQYIELASELALDVERLAQSRTGLRETMRQTLFNAKRFTQDLEHEYRTMWTRWCNEH